MEAAIQAPGPSFRDMQFCTGGGYFLDAWQKDVELVSVTFQTATFGSEGGHPSTRSVLQGHAALHWRRLLFGRLAEARGASFCNVSKGNVRQWRRPSKQRVRPSGTCGFALAEATFLDAWQVDLELVFVEFQIATCVSGAQALIWS